MNLVKKPVNSMSKDKRQGWLAELKVGDSVIVETYNYDLTSSFISQVDRITPTGRIKVDGRSFNSKGRVIAKNSSIAAALVKLDIKDLEVYLAKNRKYLLISQIKNSDLSNISLSNLEKIKSLIDNSSTND